ncbi:MAG: alpha/beta hydrolase [Patescibacteria group bacterium]
MNESTAVFGTNKIFARSIGAGKDIVFIHMSWGSSWALNNYLTFFSKHGYRCHALDLRGHGQSGGTVEGASMRDYVEDVATVVTALGLQSPIVIGHSMGGLVAMMYGAAYPVAAVVSLDGSPTFEAQGTSGEEIYPAAYRPTDAGMPTNPLKAMMALPDIYPWHMMQLKKHLTVESGVARSDRKRGVSIPKESIKAPLFFVGAEKGTSLPFGIGIAKATAGAQYYNAPVYEVKGATHPGLLIGKYWKDAAEAILKWLQEHNL